MEDTLRGALRAVNVDSVDLSILLVEAVQTLRAIRDIAEKFTAAEHLWQPPADPGRDRRDKESQAIVMAHTMERPNLNSISKALGVPRSTLQRWKHLAEALEQKNGPVRGARHSRDRRGVEYTDSGDDDT